MGGKGEGFSGKCIKDTWTKPKGGRIKGGKWGWLGWEGVVGGTWRQLYLNNKKKCEKNHYIEMELILPMYNAHPHFSFKNLGRKVCIIHGKIQYLFQHWKYIYNIDRIYHLNHF